MNKNNSVKDSVCYFMQNFKDFRKLTIDLKTRCLNIIHVVGKLIYASAGNHV